MNIRRKMQKHSIPSMVLLVLVAQTALGALIYFMFDNWSHRGTFGDMFGAINTLFSGLALGFVAITLHFQQKELELVRRREHARVQPDFERQGEQPNPGDVRVLTFKNRGGQARALSATSRSQNFDVKIHPEDFLDRGSSMNIIVHHKSKKREAGEFEIRFKDELGGDSIQRFE